MNKEEEMQIGITPQLDYFQSTLEYLKRMTEIAWKLQNKTYI